MPAAAVCAAGTHERLTISNMNETGIGGWGGPLPVLPGSPANECVLQLEPYSSQAQEEAQAMTLLNFNRSCCRRPAHGRPIITRSRPGDDRRDVHRSEFLIQSARPAVSVVPVTGQRNSLNKSPCSTRAATGRADVSHIAGRGLTRMIRPRAVFKERVLTGRCDHRDRSISRPCQFLL